MVNDLTKGKPLKKILIFMIPLLIGNIFQQIYSMADTIIVGRTLGADALAGVGSTGAINFLIIGFVTGLTAGFSVITSQLFGANDDDGVRKSVATSIWLCIAITIVMTLVSVFCTKLLLTIMSTHPDIFGYAYDYIIVIFGGLGTMVFYNMMSCIVRALGDSRTPLYFLIFASFVNVGLDFLFIINFEMGTAGAAWATIISQFLAGLGCTVYMFIRFKILRMKRSDWKLSSRFAWKHLRVGLPMALQYSITAIGVIVQQTALNQLGKVAVAAYTAASKIDALVTQMMVSLGMAITTYVGQNYGAGEYDRIKEGVNKSAIIAVIMGVVGFLVVWTLATPLTMLFIENPSAEILSLSKEVLFIQGLFYILLALLLLYRAALQGMGRSTLTMVAGAIELAARIFAALVFVRFFEFTGLCFSNPASWVGAVIFLIIAYYYIIRKYKTKKPKAENDASGGKVEDVENIVQTEQNI